MCRATPASKCCATVREARVGEAGCASVHSTYVTRRSRGHGRNVAVAVRGQLLEGAAVFGAAARCICAVAIAGVPPRGSVWVVGRSDLRRPRSTRHGKQLRCGDRDLDGCFHRFVLGSLAGSRKQQASSRSLRALLSLGASAHKTPKGRTWIGHCGRQGGAHVRAGGVSTTSQLSSAGSTRGSPHRAYPGLAAAAAVTGRVGLCLRRNLNFSHHAATRLCGRVWSVWRAAPCGWW